MPGVVDGRLPRQFLEVRAARDLREHSGAGRPEWLADGPKARRASVSDKDGRRAEINECNEKTSRFTPNRASPSSLVRDSRSCWYKLQARASAGDSGRRTRDGFFEVHAENYMGAGGPPHHALEQIRRDYHLSLHGVAMSIGVPQTLDRNHLERFRALAERYEPAVVSEHLAWSTHETTYFNDLLPLPYTEATLSRVSEHVDEVQQAIRRPILLENPSTYVVFRESAMS